MAGRIERLGANMSLTRKVIYTVEKAFIGFQCIPYKKVLRFGRPLGLSITLVKLIEDYLKSL